MNAHNRLHVSPGDRFSRFTIVEEVASLLQNGTTRRQFICRCDCGNVRTVQLHKLRGKKVKSCGCIRGELQVIHGYAKKKRKKGRTYVTWMSMRNRCNNPSSSDYACYGGRGITICERWSDFRNFVADMGERPTGMEIDRYPNKNGNYEPGNCRWATRTEQNRNARTNVLITHNGQTLCLAEWAERAGISWDTLFARIKRLRWSPERAITTPVATRRRAQ